MRPEDVAAVEVGTCFLTALFDPSDNVLFRPIETWVDGAKKQSRPIYPCIRHVQASTDLPAELSRQMAASGTTMANIFFGVCPRLGGEEQYDQAWQIRTVRCIWSDVDHATVDEVVARIESAGLPKPSAVVNSGNGVHLYWLLDEPYLIDDAGDPPAVQKAWVPRSDGKKRLRKYIAGVQGGERLYLDIRGNVPALSPRAIHIQDVVAGVAAAIGGDHTQDLSRLMRVPGTLNRKDERNGRVAVPCELVACDAALRYPLATFEEFAKKSPQASARQKIAAIPLPSRKPFTPVKRDKISGYVTACALAPVGGRSETDWALICAAIENSWPKDEVWQAVSNVGKFAEAGKAHF
jgi:hypothetical protein